MKYTDYRRLSLGVSDIANLTVLGIQNNTVTATVIPMGSDGKYRGYLADDRLDTTGLTLLHEFTHWVNIFDDDSRVFIMNERYKLIRIYIVQTDRGKNEVIIQLIN